MTYMDILSLFCTQDTARPARGSQSAESNRGIFVHTLAGLASVICLGVLVGLLAVLYFRVINRSMN
jgi:hypothetical protein